MRHPQEALPARLRCPPRSCPVASQNQVWQSRSSNRAPNQFGRTILYGTGFVNRAWKIAGALKLLEKVRKNHGDVTSIPVHYEAAALGFRTRNIEFAPCPKFAADFAGCGVAALSCDAPLSYRPSGLDAYVVALDDAQAGRAAMDRFQCDFAPAAKFGGWGGRCSFLQASRR